MHYQILELQSKEEKQVNWIRKELENIAKEEAVVYAVDEGHVKYDNSNW